MMGHLSDRLMLDGGLSFGWNRQGTNAVHQINYLTALDARLHWVWRLSSAEVTAGVGPIAYAVLSSVSALGVNETAPLAFQLGAEAVLGTQLKVARWPVRFEVAVQTRGARIDVVPSFAVGWPG